MNLRKIIREQISRVFQEEDATGADNAIGGTITDIGAMIQKDVENMSKIIDTQKTSLKNDKEIFKQDSQKKNALSPKIGDVDNAEKKGLERSLPLKAQLNQSKEKQIKDLEDAQNAMQIAKRDLDKKAIDIEKQAELSGKGEKTASTSSLPSLPSAI